MKIIHFLVYTVLIYSLLCLDMSQNMLAQQIPSLPVANVAPNTSTAPTAVPPLSNQKNSPLVNSAVIISDDKTKVSIIKYYEFKSICEKDEVSIAQLSDNIKKKRIELLKNKIESSGSDTEILSLKKLLIKEYIKQNLTKTAEDYLNTQGHKLTEVEQINLSADIDIQKKLYRQAKANLNKYLEAHPKDIESLEKLAEIYNHIGNYTDAKNIYDDLIKLNPKKNYDDYLCQNAALNADHFSTMINCEKVIKSNSKNYYADIYKGISFRNKELYAEAIKHFEKSYTLQKNEFASTCLGEAYFLIKNYEKSSLAYEESIKIKPDSKRAHLGLANALAKRNLHKDALEQYKSSCLLGLKPLTEMTEIANALKIQKNNLANLYFDQIQNCRN